MKLAIVGSRNFTDWNTFLLGIKNFKQLFPEPIECIISGGAQGADNLAKQYANLNSISYQEFSPDWKTYGKSAGIRRNHDIILASTHVLAFPSRSGKGTQHSMSLADKIGKFWAYYYID